MVYQIRVRSRTDEAAGAIWEGSREELLKLPLEGMSLFQERGPDVSCDGFSLWRRLDRESPWTRTFEDPRRS